MKKTNKMDVTKFKKLKITTSRLGFGCMRFPTNDDGTINEVEAEAMIDYAMEHGVNYYDTAYPYHNGQSEVFLGKILDKYPRKNYYIATKLPIWEVENVEDARRIFDEQLTRLNKDYVDFYLLHALNKERFKKVKELGIIKFLENLREEGKIKYIGFSFHDDLDCFLDILKYYKWDFGQIQYNYMDQYTLHGRDFIYYSSEIEMPLIIMEPLKGGLLAKRSLDVSRLFKDYKPTETYVSWALRFVASHRNTAVILSGMSSLEQVKENVKIFSPFVAYDTNERQIIRDVIAKLEKRVKNGCTGCRYCMPCPYGVDIPRSFHLWNTASIYNNEISIKASWNALKENSESPYSCHKCGVCEEKCPQKIKIRDDLEKITEQFKDL